MSRSNSAWVSTFSSFFLSFRFSLSASVFIEALYLVSSRVLQRWLFTLWQLIFIVILPFWQLWWILLIPSRYRLGFTCTLWVRIFHRPGLPPIWHVNGILFQAWHSEDYPTYGLAGCTSLSSLWPVIGKSLPILGRGCFMYGSCPPHRVRCGSSLICHSPE